MKIVIEDDNLIYILEKFGLKWEKATLEEINQGVIGHISDDALELPSSYSLPGFAFDD